MTADLVKGAEQCAAQFVGRFEEAIVRGVLAGIVPDAFLRVELMMPAGDGFPGVDSSSAGFHFVRKIRQQWPRMAIICLSVIADVEKIEELKRQNILYLRKGETPLETAIKLIESKATGKMSF